MATKDPNSIVDYIKSTGGDSSLAGRTKLAQQYGVTGQVGSADWNLSLLTKLRGAAVSAPPATATAVTDPSSANAFINGNQDADFASASDAKGDTPPVRTSTKTWEQAFAEAQKSFAPSTKAPEAPDFTKQYKALLDTTGVTGLETTLNELKSQQKLITDQEKARIAAEGEKPVAMNVIAGRQSEEARQAQLRLDPIVRQIEEISNQLTTKYNVVNNLMEYSKLDYASAVDRYDTQFTQNLNLFNTVKGIMDDEKDEVERAEDNARANLQIIYNNISAGGSDPSSFTADQKANVTKLELQAGLPVGFYSSLQSKNPKSDILSTTTRDSGGQKYADVIMKNADGSLSVKTVSLGKTNSGSSSNNMTEGETKNSGFSSLNAILDNPESTTSNGEPVKDSNGFITPKGLKQMIKYGATQGISRSEILEQYGGDLYADEGYAGYGLTGKEIASLSY